MNHSESITDLLISLHAFQAEITEPGKDSRNPHLKNKYASLPAVRAHCQPLLSKYNLGITQLPCSQDGGHPGVETVLFHGPTGQWISNRITMPVYTQKGANEAQIAGAIITYLRRYSWLAILGLSSEDNDAADAAVEAHRTPDGSNGSRQRDDSQGDPGQFASNDSWKQVIRDFIRGPLSEARGSRYMASEVDTLCLQLVGCAFGDLNEAVGVRLLKALEDESRRLRSVEAPSGQ